MHAVFLLDRHVVRAAERAAVAELLGVEGGQRRTGGARQVQAPGEAAVVAISYVLLLGCRGHVGGNKKGQPARMGEDWPTRSTLRCMLFDGAGSDPESRPLHERDPIYLHSLYVGFSVARKSGYVKQDENWPKIHQKFVENLM